jgi:hypothetical protein
VVLRSILPNDINKCSGIDDHRALIVILSQLSRLCLKLKKDNLPAIFSCRTVSNRYDIVELEMSMSKVVDSMDLIEVTTRDNVGWRYSSLKEERDSERETERGQQERRVEEEMEKRGGRQRERGDGERVTEGKRRGERRKERHLRPYL